LNLPSDDSVVKYRPFTVKEEKILLVAQESKDPNQMVLAMRQIATNCCPDISIDELAMFDLEYIMLQIRSKSIDNKINFTINDPDTNNPVNLELDIDEIDLTTDESHTKEITISDEMYLMMRYPRLNEVSVFLNVVENPTESLFDVMIACIDCVVAGDEVQKLEDFTKEEVIQFVETFPGGTIDAIQKFFETMPKLRFKSTYMNSEGEEKEVLLEGTETFFL